LFGEHVGNEDGNDGAGDDAEEDEDDGVGSGLGLEVLRHHARRQDSGASGEEAVRKGEEDKAEHLEPVGVLAQKPGRTHVGVEEEEESDQNEPGSDQRDDGPDADLPGKGHSAHLSSDCVHDVKDYDYCDSLVACN